MEEQNRETAEAASVEIEIPEPDYDDIPLDDDVGDVVVAAADAVPVPAVSTDDVSAAEVSPGDDVTTTTSSQPVTQQPSFDADVVETQQKYNFDEVRAKLEAFSREEQHVLAGSIIRDPNIPEPDPDYSDDDNDEADDRNRGEAGASFKVESTAAAASKEQQSLVKELARKQKLGVNLLNKKSELDKEFEKRKMRQQQREDEENRRKHRSSFDIRMEEQANKIILAEKQRQLAPDEDDNSQPEFIKVHSKISKVKSACS